jgi:hypothetical protein
MSGRKMKALISLFAMLLCSIAYARTYKVQVEEGPVLDAGPNTYMGKISIEEGTPLLEWLGGESNIERILIGTPHLNSKQLVFSEQLVRNRFAESTCVDSKKNAWHYAPYTMGTIYLKDGEKVNFTMYLSGIVVGEHLFAIPMKARSESVGSFDR